MYKILGLIGLFICGPLLWAQSSQEFDIDFGSSEKGEEFQVDWPADVPFVGISAYVLQKNVSVTFFLRTQQNGIWTEWEPLKLFTEGHTEGRTTFEGPMISQSFEAIQFKSSEEIDATVRFRLYFPTTTEKKTERQTIESTTANCSCPKPVICERNCWCPTNNCPKDNTPSYTTTDHLIVHHSAGSNNNTDWGAVVAFIWDLHVNTNGWDDIGYNWLVDPQGNVYEGRGDSVQGAHFSCMNGTTSGICLMGNFSNISPKDSAIDGLVSILAWLACKYNIAPELDSYHNSSQLMLPNIAGHRHGNASTAPNSCAVGTVCPGDSLFALLDQIRDSTGALACLGDVSLVEEVATVRDVVYPNPSEELVVVKTEGSIGMLKVYDPTGRLVLERQLTGQREERITEIADWPSGVYQFRLSQGTEGWSTKVIKP